MDAETIAKTAHMAAKCTDKGQVSALCYSRPRAINLRLTTWTIRRDAVTCPRCKAILTAQEPRA